MWRITQFPHSFDDVLNLVQGRIGTYDEDHFLLWGGRQWASWNRVGCSIKHVTGKPEGREGLDPLTSREIH
jgi:hypothetical protein